MRGPWRVLTGRVNPTDGWQNVWGGEEAVFTHNVISDFVGEGTLLKDGDVTNVKYMDNLIVGREHPRRNDRLDREIQRVWASHLDG